MPDNTISKSVLYKSIERNLKADGNGYVYLCKVPTSGSSYKFGFYISSSDNPSGKVYIEVATGDTYQIYENTYSAEVKLVKNNGGYFASINGATSSTNVDVRFTVFYGVLDFTGGDRSNEPNSDTDICSTTSFSGKQNLVHDAVVKNSNIIVSNSELKIDNKNFDDAVKSVLQTITYQGEFSND